MERVRKVYCLASDLAMRRRAYSLAAEPTIRGVRLVYSLAADPGRAWRAQPMGRGDGESEVGGHSEGAIGRVGEVRFQLWIGPPPLL